MAAREVEAPGGGTESNTCWRSHGNPARRYGYPRGWVASDPQNSPRCDIHGPLDRIEELLHRLDEHSENADRRPVVCDCERARNGKR
jgi:hypothetical protein